MSLINTCFKNAIGEKSVPTSASHGGATSEPNLGDLPGRSDSPNGVKELHRDGCATGSPSRKGPIGTNFKNAIGK
jgi:hypothetical protein